MKRPHVIIPKNPDDTVKLRSNVDFRAPNHVMPDETLQDLMASWDEFIYPERVRACTTAEDIPQEHSDGERDD